MGSDLTTHYKPYAWNSNAKKASVVPSEPAVAWSHAPNITVIFVFNYRFE
jgi:hypothetical protein